MSLSASKEDKRISKVERTAVGLPCLSRKEKYTQALMLSMRPMNRAVPPVAEGINFENVNEVQEQRSCFARLETFEFDEQDRAVFCKHHTLSSSITVAATVTVRHTSSG